MYVNEGQKPFIAPDTTNLQSKEAKKLVRMANRKYYKSGMPSSKVRHCSRCKKPMARGVCHVCGIKADILPERIECPKCKTLILKDAFYCYNCKAWNEQATGN